MNCHPPSDDYNSPSSPPRAKYVYHFESKIEIEKPYQCSYSEEVLPDKVIMYSDRDDDENDDEKEDENKCLTVQSKLCCCFQQNN